MNESYRCWAEIDRRALRHNAKVVRDRIGAAELLAVVKANAYGHGLVGVAEALEKDAKLFGVANLEEAIQLRAALPHPIMILGPALPQEIATIAEGGFIPTISSFEEAGEFNRVARDGPISINFKIDTGMGRMGVPESEALDVFQKLPALLNIKIHSISTHHICRFRMRTQTTPVSSFSDLAKSLSNFVLRFRGISKRTCCKAPAHSRLVIRSSTSCVPASCFTVFRRC